LLHRLGMPDSLNRLYATFAKPSASVGVLPGCLRDTSRARSGANELSNLSPIGLTSPLDDLPLYALACVE
jgi:hypothetical protein